MSDEKQNDSSSPSPFPPSGFSLYKNVQYVHLAEEKISKPSQILTFPKIHVLPSSNNYVHP